jgi:hypothetical protein
MSTPAVASRPWWQRSKPADAPPPAPASPAPASLRSQRSQLSLSPVATGSAPPLAPGAPSPSKKGIKGALSAIRLRSKRSLTDGALLIQDPPPLPPVPAPVRTRPPAKSVSSTIDPPPEPRTPSDHRASFPHSLLPLGDDPFSRTGPDPNRLSVHSSLRAAKRAPPPAADARVSYASASSSGHSYLSSPWSPQTVQSSEISSPSWSVYTSPHSCPCSPDSTGHTRTGRTKAQPARARPRSPQVARQTSHWPRRRSAAGAA